MRPYVPVLLPLSIAMERGRGVRFPLAQAHSIPTFGERLATVAPTGGRAMLGALRRFMRTSPLGTASAVFLVLLVFVAIFASKIAPYSPLTNNYAVARHPPSVQYWAGTDSLGRDVFSRILYGLRVSLVVSLSSVVLSATIGTLWGVTSGYIGGKYDILSQRLIEVLTSFPTLILALLLSVSLRPGLRTVIIAIGVTQIPLATADHALRRAGDEGDGVRGGGEVRRCHRRRGSCCGRSRRSASRRCSSSRR